MRYLWYDLLRDLRRYLSRSDDLALPRLSSASLLGGKLGKQLLARAAFSIFGLRHRLIQRISLR